MTPSELTQFRQHPSLGIELLQPVCILDLPVINIVHQHHERINKTGFPYQLADGDIDPRTKIVSVADEFASLIRSRQLAPMAAFQLLMQNDEIMAGLDRSAVLTLQDCFHQ